MPDRLDFAQTRHLKLVQAAAHQCLGVLITMLLIVELQPLPEVCVHRIGIGSLVLTVRRRLGGKQRVTAVRADVGVPKHRFGRGDRVDLGVNVSRGAAGQRQCTRHRGEHHERSRQGMSQRKAARRLIEGGHRLSHRNMRHRKRNSTHPVPFDPDALESAGQLLGAKGLL